MNRHASAEDLAGLDLDGLKPRKAARVRQHVSGCIQCTQLSSQVSAVPTLLASVPYPSMPPSLASQLDTALASESTRRLASAPATEAGRRDLPERRARKPRVGWQLPGMSVVATRLVAAAGALIILGVGGYVITSNTGSNLGGTAASSSGAAAAPSAQHVSLGPTVEYGQPSATKTVRTVQSTTNFTAANLGAEAEAAVQAAASKGAEGARPAHAAVPGSTMGAMNSPSSPTHGQASASANLTGCLDAIVGSQPVQLVDIAKFDGQPATIIVTQQTAARPAEVWVVGPACSASNHDVKAHQTLSGV